jgi:hypothetical protein
MLALVSIGGLLLGACRASEQPTRVTRSDGTVVVGALIQTLPDAVVLRVDGRDVRIPLSEIKAIGRDTTPTPGPAPTARADGGEGGGTPTAPPEAPVDPRPGGRASTTTPTPRSSETPMPAARTADRTAALVVPAGTRLSLTMGSEVSSTVSRASDRVDATLAQAVRIGGVEALPGGLTVGGAVVESLSGERGRGRGRVVLRFDRLRTLRDGEIVMQTEPVRIEPAVRQRRGFGGVFDKVVRKTKGVLGIEGPGGNVRLAAGSRVVVELVQPLTVRVVTKG